MQRQIRFPYVVSPVMFMEHRFQSCSRSWSQIYRAVILCIAVLVGAPAPVLARPDQGFFKRVGTALRQHKERFLSKFARPPKITAVKIKQITAAKKHGRSMTTIEFEVQGKNPNWLGVRARDIRWEASIPRAPGVTAKGKMDALKLPARGSFKAMATAMVPTGSLPADLIRDGTLPIELKTSMTAKTALGTIHFGSGKVKPLRSVNSSVPLTNKRLHFNGTLGSDYLAFRVGLPKPRVMDLRSKTLLSIKLNSPVGIPFKVVGGTMTVKYDGVEVGTARLPNVARVTGYTIKKKGRGSSVIKVPLVTEHRNLPSTLHQIRALLDATDRRAGTKPITLEGTFEVRPVAGTSIGEIRELPFKIALGPDNFSRRPLP